jgi:hypothetical protein
VLPLLLVIFDLFVHGIASLDVASEVEKVAFRIRRWITNTN